jgi:hypothetical protein
MVDGDEDYRRFQYEPRNFPKAEVELSLTF